MKKIINDGIESNTVNGGVIPRRLTKARTVTRPGGSGITVLNYEENSLNAHLSDFGNPHRVTSEQVGSEDALWNANKLQGFDISIDEPSDGQVLQWNESESKWEAVTIASIVLTTSTATDLTGYIKGNGSVLSASATVAATDLTGTLNDARLSSNVPLKNTANTFTTTQTIQGTILADEIDISGLITGANLVVDGGSINTSGDGTLNVSSINATIITTTDLTVTSGITSLDNGAITTDTFGNVVSSSLAATTLAASDSVTGYNLFVTDQLHVGPANQLIVNNSGDLTTTGNIYLGVGSTINGLDGSIDIGSLQAGSVVITTSISVATDTVVLNSSGIEVGGGAFTVQPDGYVNCQSLTLQGGSFYFNDIGDLQCNGLTSQAAPVIFNNLPTTDPVQSGQLWLDPSADYVLKVSQG